ncbi:cache domain-containing protein [Desulfosarcina sp.]|uniref:cache domain-containing protein n=1 Tax=Desulfosarcina sp. TaxID=2027861 RepID=UPI0029BCF15C|nr:cache domain-containing protein [Desulfosarcina sp.]MDX2451498.1 cache domain-containing protein [Desulfosarcina sp.]
MGPNSTTPHASVIPIRFLLPAVLTVLLFAMTIFLVILPMVEERLMEGKREMIRELVESAWSSLDGYAARVKAGELTRRQAQTLAAAHIRRLRFGPESKDYFWINDMLPRMITHPYRPDLEGQDVSTFMDSGGKKLFVACVTTVRTAGSGYVDYTWQWQDDPRRIVPKISYVKGFAPWGWIVGSGIYVEDVRAEIAAITGTLAIICLGILAVIVGLLTYAVWHGARITREKQRAEQQARMRREQLFQAAKMVSLGTLVSGVAHEINNPITSIMLNAPSFNKFWEAALPVLDQHVAEQGDFPVAGSSYSRLRERIPQMLASIAADARRVSDIVADLKDFAREKPPEMRDSVDVNDVVQKAIGLATNLIRKSTRHFDATYARDVPTFKGNAQRIEQVVINLVVNACQALTADEQPVTVTTRWDRAADQVVIEVRDAGAGIPADAVQRIKDPFFTTKRDNGGTGLGLAISEKIMQDHGGRLTFETEPQKGTTVRVFFPLQPNETAGGGDE